MLVGASPQTRPLRVNLTTLMLRRSAPYYKTTRLTFQPTPATHSWAERLKGIYPRRADEGSAAVKIRKGLNKRFAPLTDFSVRAVSYNGDGEYSKRARYKTIAIL